jgi:hypothetical protein
VSVDDNVVRARMAHGLQKRGMVTTGAPRKTWRRTANPSWIVIDSRVAEETHGHHLTETLGKDQEIPQALQRQVGRTHLKPPES